MKLMFCPDCCDFVALRKEIRVCACGLSKGRHLEDGDTVEINDVATLIGVSNSAFLAAFRAKDRADESVRNFKAWVFNPTYHKIERIKESK